MIIISNTVKPEQIATDTAAAIAKETVTEPAAADAVKTEVLAETAEDSGSKEQTQEEKDALAANAAEEEEEEEGDDAEPSKEETPAKPLKGFKKRIDKLVKDRNLISQERDALRVQLEQMRAGTNKPAEKKPEPTATGEPNVDAFETHAEYVKALTKWQVKEAQAESSTLSEQDKLVNRYNEGLAKVKKQFADHKEVTDAVADVSPSPALCNLLLESENGAELAYHLAKNPDELERINSLKGLAAAREFGKFEASLPKAAAKETKKLTTAPDPIRPLGSGKAQVAKKTLSEAAASSQAEYEAMRNAQSAKNAQR